MAELAIKIGDSPQRGRYEDGDVIQAFNRRRIRLVHAQMICHPRIGGRKVAGQLGASQPLLEKYFQRTAQYKWERVSKTLVRRINLWTLDEVTYGSMPIEDPDRPGRMIHCHVDVHFAFRRKGRLPIFGADGAEVEYGGYTKQDTATVEKIWDDVETATTLRRTDYDCFPAGTEDLKVHLFVTTDDFDDATAEAYATPLMRDTGELDEDKQPIYEEVKRRKHHVDWESSVAGLSASAADIRDRTKSVDLRAEHTFACANIVLAKSLE